MRRSIFAGIGVAAVLVVAACSPDQASTREPLAPGGPVLAVGDQCAGSIASEVSKQQKALFSGAALTDLQNQFSAIKTACPGPTTFGLMMSYLDAMIGYYDDVAITGTRSQTAAAHLSSVTAYATGNAVVRLASVFGTQGGAGVVNPVAAPGDYVTTWDGRTRLDIAFGSTPTGPHLFTFEPKASSFCDGTTSLRVTGNCFDVQDYPDETVTYTGATISMCLHSTPGPTGIGHEKASFGAEVLPEAAVPTGFSCSHVASALDSWLGREAGPLGRMVARAYDYLRPAPLFADDVGESGSIGSFSLVGGVLNVVFQDNFGEIGTPPDIGDAWQVDTSFPGFIRVQASFGLLTDSVVVLSQAQGNCANCPTFQLLGTRVNSSQIDLVGSYQVTWTALQNKPSVKEAPFVLLNETGAEIARLSYVSLQNQGNRLLFTVQQPGTDSVYDVGAWVRDQPQDFKITVHQTVLGSNDNSVSFGFGINPADPPLVGPVATPFASQLMKVGYVLTGIDAGVIASNKWVVIRLSDTP